MAKYTDNYNLKKPDGDDFYNIQDFNENADSIDKELKKQSDRIKGIETPTFSESQTNENIQSKEPLPTLLGKVKRAITRLSEHILSSNPHLGSSPIGHKHAVSDISSGTLAITRGGTGATSASDARNKLEITPENIGAEPALGFIPIQQGGGTEQKDNKIYIGWTDKQLKAQVDETDMGAIITTGAGNSVTLPVNKGGTGATTAAQALKNLGINVSATLINHLSNLTGNVQAQLNGKAASSHSHSTATTSAAGFLSAADKVKLNGIATGAQKNTVTGVKGSGESSYRTGNINISPENLGLRKTYRLAEGDYLELKLSTFAAGIIGVTGTGADSVAGLFYFCSSSVATAGCIVKRSSHIEFTTSAVDMTIGLTNTSGVAHHISILMLNGTATEI